MLKKDYLRVSYSGRLPMLIFSEKGWEIEAETFAEEIYQRFCLDLQEKQASKNVEFIPMLEQWKMVEVRKVRERIESVQKSLEQ